MHSFFGVIKVISALAVTISLMSLYPWGTVTQDAGFGLLLIFSALFIGTIKTAEWLLNKCFYNYYYKRGILLHHTEEFDPMVTYNPGGRRMNDDTNLFRILEFRDGSKICTYNDGRVEHRNLKGEIIYEK